MLFLLACLPLSTLYASSIEVLESRYVFDGTLDAEAVRQKHQEFEHFDYTSASFGFNDDDLWIYMKIQSQEQRTERFIIEFLYALHDYLYVYEFSGGSLVESYLTGDMTMHSTRKLDTLNFTIPTEMNAGEVKEFVFKINSKSDLSVGLRVLPEREYYKVSKKYELFLSFYYGAVLVMILYNFLLFTFIREKAYLYYVLFHLFLWLTFMSSNGISFALFWPDTPEINNHFLPIVFIWTNIFTILFTLNFLEISKHNSRLFSFFRAVLVGHSMLFLGIFVFGVSIFQYMLIFSIFSVISLYLCGIYLLITKNTIASRFYVVAWSFPLGGVVIEMLQGLGVLEMRVDISHAAQVGSLIEVVLFSIALAHRYKRLNAELYITTSKLEELNLSLHRQVEEKTKKLQLLLNELQHRVKNNFQVILTFLFAQKKSIKNNHSPQSALEDSIHRIQAVASLHQLLDLSSESASINVRHYLEGIANSLHLQRADIDYHIAIEPLILGYERTVMLGLVLNELITNSIKHAKFPKDRAVIDISLSKNQEGYRFKYRDNGEGFSPSHIEKGSGLGFFLIQGLTEKNGATLSFGTDAGMECVVEFCED